MAIVPADIGSTPFTYRDLEGMPDDGRTYELSHGALVVTPAANTVHARTVSRLVVLLAAHLGADQEVLAEAELLIRDDTVKRPDVQVVPRDQIGGQHITGTPALVVEVLSPSTAVLDRTEKRHVYAEAAVPAYWLVDPDTRTITVLELEGGAYVERAVVAPGDSCAVTSPTRFVLEAVTVFGD